MPTLYPGNAAQGRPFPGLELFEEVSRGRNAKQIADTLAYIMSQLSKYSARYVKFQPISGPIDNFNLDFTLSQVVRPNSFWLILNGSTQEPYNQFTAYYMDGTTIVATMDPLMTDIPAGATSMKFSFVIAPDQNGTNSSQLSMALLV